MKSNEATVPKTFEVTWSMIYEAPSAEDAVRQALGDLATVLAHPTEGPNFFLVSHGEELTVVAATDIDNDSPSHE